MTIQEKVAFVKTVYRKAEIDYLLTGYSVWNGSNRLTPSCKTAQEAWEKAYEVARLER